MTMADQLKRSDLAGMSPEAITAAYAAGRCDRLLGKQGKREVVGLDPFEVERLKDDDDALAAYVASVRAKEPGADLGARGGTPSAYTRAWLLTASHREIYEACNRGDLRQLLDGTGPHA